MPSIFRAAHASGHALDTLKLRADVRSAVRSTDSARLADGAVASTSSFGRRECTNLLGFGCRFRRDLLRFRKASGGAHFRFGLGGDMERLALGLALRGDHLGELAPLGDFALTGGDHLLLSLNDFEPHGFGSGKRRGALGSLLGEFDRLAHFRHFDELVALGRQGAHIAILGDGLDAARACEPAPPPRRLRACLSSPPLGDLQALEMPLALEPDRSERGPGQSARLQ